MSLFTFNEGNINIEMADHATIYDMVRHIRGAQKGHIDTSTNLNDMVFAMEMYLLNYYTFTCCRCGILAEEDDKKCAALDVLSCENNMRLEGVQCRCGNLFVTPVPN